AITTLLFRYAECIDRADFAGLGQLFAHGRIRSSSGPAGDAWSGDQVREFYARTNRVHDDGTLRTRHLNTNHVVDIDEPAGVASVRSAYVVFQATPKLPFQPIVGGRYEDRFERSDAEWRWIDRLIHVDQVGDVSEHLNLDRSLLTRR
ncbi:MAG: nuclear transport factor 2 family protein, partial [Myxococcota bacterium]